jgi:hypothetical protein
VSSKPLVEESFKKHKPKEITEVMVHKPNKSPKISLQTNIFSPVTPYFS